MSDRMPEPGEAGSEPDLSHTAEFAKLRAVMRASEKHREGGVDPELDDADADPGAELRERAGSVIRVPRGCGYSLGAVPPQ